LEKLQGENLADYVVWVPTLNFQSPLTLEKNAEDAAKLIPDERTRFYSDPMDITGAAYGKIMNIRNGSPAWDIYFVFGAEARWGGEPPKPDFWMHQLWGVDSKLLLNGPVLFEHVKKLIEQARREGNKWDGFDPSQESQTTTIIMATG
jgi:hypothetical protein